MHIRWIILEEYRCILMSIRDNIENSDLESQVNLWQTRVNFDFFLKNNILLCCAFLALGFGKFIFYIPLFFVYFFFKLQRFFEIRVDNNFLVVLLLMIAYILSIFVIGYDRLMIENRFSWLFVLFFTLVFAGLAMQEESKELQLKILFFYITGIGIDALLISSYSYWVDSSYYGYGRLLDPYAGIVVNSPIISNNLAIFSVALFLIIFNYKNYYLKIISVLFLGCCVFFGFFLGGRAYFIIIAFVLLVFFLYNLSIKRIVNFFLFLIFIFVFSFIVINYLNLGDGVFKNGLNMLDKGLESNRFLLYKNGLNLIPAYPFGGFGIDKTIEDVQSFHNVFLDSARLAGWLPVFFLFMAILLISYVSFLSGISKNAVPFIIFITSVLIMQQDVIIEGNYRMLMVMYFSGLVILKKELIPFENIKFK